MIFLLLYRIMALESSVTMETQLKMAPDKIPFVIIGTVILTKVFNFEAPKLMEASSILTGIWDKVAAAERIVYGIRRMTSAKIMMAAVPVSAKGLEPKAITNAIPMTEPGIIYGSIERVSIVWFNLPGRLTAR